MNGSFHLPDLMALESEWDFNDDDQSNEIYNIYIDTLVKGKLDIYLLYANCLMRKFSGDIPDYEGEGEL